MPATTKQAPAGASLAVNGITPQPDYLRIAQSLKTAITTFASDTGFRTLSQLADQIPQLKNDIKNKDDQIHALTAQLDAEREAHVAEQQKELGNFGRMYGTLKDEKATLQATIDSQKVSLQDKDKDRATLQKELDEIKAKGRELKGKYEAKIIKLKEKDQEIADLLNQLRVIHASADDSSKKLNESRSRVGAGEVVGRFDKAA